MPPIYKKTDPDFAPCFGPEAGRFGVWTLWHISGGLEHRWSKEGGICDRIQEILVDQRQTLRPRVSLVNAKAPTYVLRCYLVGRDVRHAAPYAAIICRNKYLRDKAKEVIRDHGILKDTGLGFLRLAACVTRSMNVQDVESMAPSPDSSQLFALDPLTAADYSTFSVTCLHDKTPYSPVGCPIAIRSDTHQRIATLGGILNINGSTFGVTVAHAFRNIYPDETGSTELELDEDDLEFSLSDRSTSEDESVSIASPTLRHEQQQPSELAAETPTSEPVTFTWNAPVVGELRLLSWPDQDYALISLGDTSPFWGSNSILIANPGGPVIQSLHGFAESMPETGTPVMIAAGFGINHLGHSVESASILDTGDPDMGMRVWTLTGVSVPNGICGAWAFIETSWEWMGMVIASCSALKEVYLAPAQHVVCQIQLTASVDSINLPQLDLDLFRTAIQSAATSVVDLLLSQGSSPNTIFSTRSSTLIYDAVISGNISMVKSLIARGADVNKGLEISVYTALSEACYYGHLDILRGLVTAGADIDRESQEITWNPLYAAIERGDIGMVELLIAQGAGRDEIYRRRTMPALFSAFRGGDTAVFEFFFAQGADVNKTERIARLSAEEAEEMHPNENVRAILARTRNLIKKEKEEETKEEEEEQTKEDTAMLGER